MILFLSFLFLTFSFLFQSDALGTDINVNSFDRNWQFITISDDNKYEIYCDLNLLKFSDNRVSCLVKFYPAKAIREREKQNYLKNIERFREVLGEDFELPNDWEKLLEASFEENSIYFTYEVNCVDKKIYVVNQKKYDGLVKLNFIIDVKENSSDERIYDFLCSFKRNGNR